MNNDLPLTREAILDAAEQVLRRFGPDKTSVVDIAKVLRVSHGTVYRHFASKASLREAVTERWLHKSIAEPLEAIAGNVNGSAVERLKLWLEALIHAKQSFSLQDSEMFAMYAAVTLDTIEMIATHVDCLIEQIARIIRQGMDSAEFKPGQPEVLARSIFIATSRFHHPAHAREWLAETIDADFDAVWNLILLGIE
ncbi:TetR family transcriptional regulator [Cohnella lupini]|uniref:TetR family transcriptional regulator n=1 Tax=Cohnella lupini TaxID=1294267 RepID=A0A3D9I2M4_9BACL|nr:TetR family transcriptional regulator [Cohnella lupini]RED56027.1 TetR family transcriptional regulator [Cohnella lupini]